MAESMKKVAAVFLVLAVLACLFLPERKNSQYDMVILGDSMMGNEWGTPNITDVIGTETGMNVFNGTFGGTGMAFYNESLWGSRSSAQWCMAELARAISYDDWGSIRGSMGYANHYRMTNTQTLEYFFERMQELSEIDFSKVQILLIEHGTNDYNAGRVLDNKEDPFDIETFGGALRSSLALLRQAYPEMRIILIAPAYCELGEDRGNKCYNTDYGGGYLTDYVELEKQIAREFEVEVLDAYHEAGIGEENADIYLIDGLHPSAKGCILLGEWIADYLEKKEQ